MEVIRSISIFILAALCEIGGGYLMWLSIREGKPMWYGILGAIVMVAYGVVATFQPSGFGRVYAAYGGFFIILSIFWAYQFDSFIPDRFDLIGVCLILIGVFIMYYMPRN